MKTKYLRYIIFVRANRLLGKANQLFIRVGTYRYREGLVIPVMWLAFNHFHSSLYPTITLIVNIHSITLWYWLMAIYFLMFSMALTLPHFLFSQTMLESRLVVQIWVSRMLANGCVPSEIYIHNLHYRSVSRHHSSSIGNKLHTIDCKEQFSFCIHMTSVQTIMFCGIWPLI